MEKSPHTGKSIRCKAAVSRNAGEPLQIEEIEVAPPKNWQVRIKIICTSLCHSDITFWKLKDAPGFFPRIFGHEAAGVVESVGEKVVEVSEGDVVIPVFMANCRECIDCKSEKSNFCSNIPREGPPETLSDGRSIFIDSKGEIINNWLYISSFSEYTVVDVAHLVKIDAEIAPEKACLLSCGVSTGVGAAWKVARVEVGSTVAIFGLGAVGLAVAQGAKLCGASKIIGVDLNPEKFEIGKKLGVTDFINPAEYGDKPISKVIKEMTDGGADYCFECVGLASLISDAFASCRKGWGKTVILGVELQPISISPTEILHGKSIIGSYFGGIKAKDDIPLLIKRYKDKELHLDEFITHEVGFKDINKAFDLLIQGKSIRCMIWMDI
ncbi:alcohol dehydrogenase-like 7 isoform X1 [Magnolia sinica]|uniref:alcohol dehydrogenase-like 7 isoform X1 n=1 Tax=Magnolia sinica TaxID=86752 RepID=UPI00265B541E|nr:alcohol dehydrogenase-like 7 isoform X1 [Magnolia sinica]